MRIVNFPASIAVLLLAALFFFANITQLSGSTLSSQSESYNYTNSKESNSNPEISVEEEQNSYSNRSASVHHSWLNGDQAEKLLLLEGGEQATPVECCPSVTEMTAPNGGINKDLTYVELYKDGEKRQQFHEISCRPDVLDQPCRFMERKLHSRSRCVQKYSYSYAIVVQPNLPLHDLSKHQSKHFVPTFPNQTDQYILEYIQIRNGCSCEVQSKKMKKSSKVRRKKKRNESHSNN